MSSTPRLIDCPVLGQKAPAMDTPPYPGELGKRIQATISTPGWQAWLEHQTRLINEYRLNPMDDNTPTFLEAEMEKFFFGQGSEAPSGYVPE